MIRNYFRIAYRSLLKNRVFSFINIFGLAIGLAIRYANSGEKEEVKTPLGNWNWSLISLPFLWPLFKSAREKFEETTDALTGRNRSKIDIVTKPIRKRWKELTE